MSASAPGAVPTSPETAPAAPAVPGASGRRRHTASVRRLARGVIGHGWLLLVLGLFVASAFIVPTLADVATTDDWGYTRSVEILLDEGRLTILPVVAATAVFQVLWGALFGTVFGMSLGVMRVATVVIVAIGAVGLYALCRELGVTRLRAALGTAVYLFNPLTFSLAFTFMTDPYFTSLLILSLACYVRGVRRLPGTDPAGTMDGPPWVGTGNRWLVLGSLVAGLAFLTRQQGALIPVGVALYLLAAGQLWPGRDWRAALGKVALLARVGGLTALILIGYYAWLRFVNEVPSVQQGFLDAALDRGVEGAWTLGSNLSFIALAYLGALAFPIAVAALPWLRTTLRRARVRGWVVFWVLQAVLLVGVASYWAEGRLMPYIGQFVGWSGIGPPDVFGGRPRLWDDDLRRWLTYASVAGAVLALAVICSRLGAPRSLARSRAGMVAAMFAVQALGIIPPSFQYINRGYSLDRYLLPLVPLTIVLLLWALRGQRLFQPAAWLIVAGIAVYSVMGTRDYLVYMSAVWDYARYANSIGIDDQQLDAGAAWDGYRLYTFGLENGITTRSPNTPDRPWWMTFYGQATYGTYVISGTPREGYQIVESRLYDSWLREAPQRLFLLRRL